MGNQSLSTSDTPASDSAEDPWRVDYGARKERAARRRRLADTIIVPAREDGFKRVFLGESMWYAVLIAKEMREAIRYVAAYRIAPISAITHIAEIADIQPFENTKKLVLRFRSPATEIPAVKIPRGKGGLQGPQYCIRSELLAGRWPL